MKLPFRTLVLFGALALGSATFAQTKPHAAKPAATKHAVATPKEDGPQWIISAEEMTKELGLNQDQSQKLASMEEELNANLRSMDNMPAEERNAETTKLKARHNKAVSALLTAEQNKKLDALIQKEIKMRGEKKAPPAAK